MCGNEVCTICARIKLKVRTPNVEANRYNICQEMLHWMDLPVKNPKDWENFLAPAEARKYINTHNISFASFKQFMLDAKSDTNEKKKIKKSKELDKGK